jgi:hypothetical protein
MTLGKPPEERWKTNRKVSSFAAASAINCSMAYGSWEMEMFCPSNGYTSAANEAQGKNRF